MLCFSSFVAALSPGRHNILHMPTRALRRTAGVFMPEGPEVTVHAERLHATCARQQLKRAEILSGRYAGNGAVAGRGPPAGWQDLQRALPVTVDSVRSKGKFMYFDLEATNVPQLTMWSTLGMTGAWSLSPSEHARVLLEFSNDGDEADGSWCLYYNDQRNFGTITVCSDDNQLEAKLASLGPSWLAPGGLTLDAFQAIVQRQCASKRSAAVPVAKFLMDQGKTSGIGNYILSETLYLSRVYPWAKCGDLDEAAWADVHAAAADVIERSFSSQRSLAEAQRQAEGQRRSLSVTRGTTYTFRLHVFRQAKTAQGLVVRKADGPHKRSVFWVEELQVRGKVAE